MDGIRRESLPRKSGRLCIPCGCAPTTKPGASAPGFVCSAVVPPRGGPGATVRGFCLADAVIGFRSSDVQLWAELPALAPGARCRLGRSFVSGAPQAVQWTASGRFRRRSGSIEPATPGTSHQVRNVGAGAGSSARSWLVLRGGVFHRWSLRIPMPPRWAGPAAAATAAARSTPVFTGGNGCS